MCSEIQKYCINTMFVCHVKVFRDTELFDKYYVSVLCKSVPRYRNIVYINTTFLFHVKVFRDRNIV